MSSYADGEDHQLAQQGHADDERIAGELARNAELIALAEKWAAVAAPLILQGGLAAETGGASAGLKAAVTLIGPALAKLL